MTIASIDSKKETDSEIPNLTPNAKIVLEKRYLLQNERGEVIETPSQLFRRVSKTIASNESRYGGDPHYYEKKFYEIMVNLEFLPNSPTLMNAGTSINQLSACFVLPIEDDMNSIFQAIKNAAIIHKTGGGCIAKGTKVYTTFCGIEKIDTIYDHYAKIKPLIKKDNAEIIDISDENIITFSFDKNTGMVCTKPISKIWKYHLDKNQSLTVHTEGNSSITSSIWHPFFIWEKNTIVEKRADELKEGDLLISANSTSIKCWPFTDFITINKFKLDPSLSYLLGLFQTDGSLSEFRNTKTGWAGLRLRFFSTDDKLINRYLEILKELTEKDYTAQIDKRTLKSSKRPLKYVICYDRDLNEAIKLLNRGTIGKKSKSVRIPKMIFKSPLKVIGAYIAALIDGDGHVNKSEKKLDFSTGSEEFCEDLRCLLSILGIKSRYHKKEGTRKGRRSTYYEITISGVENFRILAELILPYLQTGKKYQRIESWLLTNHSSESCPLDFTIIEPILNKIGITTKNTQFWRKSVEIGDKSFFLARWKEKNLINNLKVIHLISEILSKYDNFLSLNEKEYLELLLRVLPSLLRVKSITNSKIEDFYDFTVKDTNNYFAGTGPLFIVHNTGFSFSRLRPKNDKVQTTGGIASGPVSFMTVFNSATEIIKQGGRRRGANMGILRVDHPDILEFIRCKDDVNTLNNFNISVGLTESFMKALEKDEDYSLINPRNSQAVGALNAYRVFNEIVKMAHKNGEPGIIFLDKINAANPTPDVGLIESTNPCGEQPLLPMESCNLGSVNLEKMLKEDSIDTFKYQIDYDHLEQVITLAVRFLDNVIDVSTFPLPEIEQKTKENRKIGLGLMGFADMLIKLGIPYDSDEAREIATHMISYIRTIAIRESQNLAKERGSFPNIEKSIYTSKYPMLRNATLTTIAPTGTLSIIAGCSSGIEPLFMLTYERRVLDDDILVEGYPFFVKVAKKRGFYSKELMEQIAEKGSLQDIDNVPEDIKRIFVTAHDISPEAHVRMQAAFQTAGVDNAVSKTINFPKEATIADIENAYLLAYKLGCKGITVYRSGSRTYDVLSKKGTYKEKDQLETEKETKVSRKPRYRPNITKGITERIRVGCGTNLFITINEDEEGLAEVFLSLGKSGGCVASNIEAIGRLISLALRSRVEPEEIILQLKAIRCPSPTFGPEGPILSCADAVAKSVEKFSHEYSENGNNAKKEPTQMTLDKFSSQEDTIHLSHITSGLRPECPECGNIVEHSEGCILCRVCGYSKCG